MRVTFADLLHLVSTPRLIGAPILTGRGVTGSLAR